MADPTIFSCMGVAPAWSDLDTARGELGRSIDHFTAALDALLERDRRAVPALANCVVLVHDEDHVREPLAALLRETLADLRAEVVEASCVEEGLGEILRHHPRVVLVDYHLDNRTGVDLMREVGAAYFDLGRGIRYVLVSGRVDIESLAPIAGDLHAEAWRTPQTQDELNALLQRVRTLIGG